MVSGAGHDATVMARLGPMTMLFLRSPGGLSHHPDETVLREDVEAALDVMTAFLSKLAAAPSFGDAFLQPAGPTSKRLIVAATARRPRAEVLPAYCVYCKAHRS